MFHAMSRARDSTTTADTRSSAERPASPHPRTRDGLREISKLHSELAAWGDELRRREEEIQDNSTDEVAAAEQLTHLHAEVVAQVGQLCRIVELLRRGLREASVSPPPPDRGASHMLESTAAVAGPTRQWSSSQQRHHVDLSASASSPERMPPASAPSSPRRPAGVATAVGGGSGGGGGGPTVALMSTRPATAMTSPQLRGRLSVSPGRRPLLEQYSVIASSVPVGGPTIRQISPPQFRKPPAIFSSSNLVGTSMAVSGSSSGPGTQSPLISSLPHTTYEAGPRLVSIRGGVTTVTSPVVGLRGSRVTPHRLRQPGSTCGPSAWDVARVSVSNVGGA